MRKIIFTILAMLLLAACSTKVNKVKPPYCYGNHDCPGGFRCVDNICEDIYFPAKDIGSP